MKSVWYNLKDMLKRLFSDMGELLNGESDSIQSSGYGVVWVYKFGIGDDYNLHIPIG